jgi:hypothetical protein
VLVELEPVCVAVAPEVDVGWVAVAPLPPQKWELRQDCSQSAYLWVSAGEPVPWGQAETQLFVSSASLSLGQGTW